MPSSVQYVDVTFFAGQGNVAADKISTREQAIRDAESSSGSTLLHSCYNAFYSEIESLSPLLRRGSGINLDDFSNPQALLRASAERYGQNSVISGSTLFLIHCLRYLAYTNSSETSSKAEVLGFSSGIVPAVVVSTSSTTMNFIARAVEAYRLVLWIGIRCQIYRLSELEPVPFVDIETKPWSFVFIGMDKVTAQKAVDRFNKANPLSPIFITAVMDNSSVTVSGRPDVLDYFRTNYAGAASVHPTKINTLYHAPIHANTLRNEILSDVQRRNISFPDFEDVKVPIRSSYTGELLSPGSKSLLESVVDMVVVEPVNWDSVVSGVLRSTTPSQCIKLINFGPGNGITRSMEKSFPKGRISVVDASTGSSSDLAKPSADSIAICGMSIHMPGARSPSELWEVIEKGINTVAEIPEHRFKISDYNPTSPLNAKRSMKARTGNCIDGVDEFDNQFFKISPREARSMDPQQRILLQTAHEALDDAGYVPDSTPTFRRETFGCFIGVATHDYIQNLRDDIDVYYSTGTLKAFLSGRISYAMQWGGPSAVVDTACSSSMVAIYQGARALMNRDCNAAIVGGVNIFSSPDMFLGLDRGHFLSPTGQCKPFDASADGYSRSEGCGIFVLKRLADAISENDNILGVIRGVEVNQSGLAHSITHPHAPTQISLFERLLEKTGIAAERINVVEAHGTGTQAGDPVEMESLRSVLSHQRTAQNPLHIMSIKANIGHLEAASGAAGLAKLLLMFNRKVIPRQISLQNLNPRIEALEVDNTCINTTSVPWTPSHAGQTRMALLNNFGAAGSNAAAIIEEYVSPSATAVDANGEFIFGFTAKSEKALQDLKTRFVEWLTSSGSDRLRLADIAYTTTARRQLYPHRVCVTASSRNELVEKLSDANIPTYKSSDDPVRVVMVFSGQGSQYLGMGRSLYESNTAFREVIDECHTFLVNKGFPGVLPILTSNGESSGLTVLEEFEAYQAAIFALEYAIAKLWISWGLTPFAVIGHSLGEYAALVIADVINLEDALTIVASRVRLMVRKCETDTTGMMAISLSASEIQEIVRGSIIFSDVTVSCVNSPKDCVVSGPKASLQELKQYLDNSKRCKSVILSVPFGYHSSAMEPLLGDLTQVAEQITIRSPMIPIVSNVFGQLVMPGDDDVFNAGYFARHCAEPVQFETGIRSMLSNPSFAKVDAWLEIGPHASLLPMLKSNPLSASNGLFLTSLRKQQHPWSTLMTALSQLYMCNARISWRAVFAHIPSVSCVSLPTYPFAKTKFWVAFKEADPAAVEPPAELAKLPGIDSPVLGFWFQRPASENGMVAIFETPISKLAKFITGHSVGNHPLCPASVYIEQVLAGVREAGLHTHTIREKSHVNIRGLKFVNPLVYNPEVSRTIITKITLSDDSGRFTISSRVSENKEIVHAQGDYRIQLDLTTSSKLSRSLPVVTRHAAAVREARNGEQPEVFSRRTAYEVIFPRVVEYSSEYHTISSLTVGADGMEGAALVKLPVDHMKGNFVVHPVFMDTLLHTPGFVSNLQGGVGDAFICGEVGSIKVLPHSIDCTASYEVYCSIALLEDGSLRLSEAFAIRQGESREIVAHMKDIHFRRVRLDSLTKRLGLAAGRTVSGVEAPPKSIAQKASVPPPVALLTQSDNDVCVHVRRIVSETCAVDSAKVKDDTDLSSLGVDSMMSIEILDKLKQRFPNITLDSHTFQACDTVSDISQRVSSALPGAPSATLSQIAKTRKEETTKVEELELGKDLDLKQILASVLDMDADEIADDTDFDSLGLDSLSSIEALKAFRDAWKMDLPDNFFSLHPTIQAAQTFLSNHMRRTPLSLSPRSISDATLRGDESDTGSMLSESMSRALKLDLLPVPIQESVGTQLPLFMIHDGSGLVNYYERLPSLGRDLRGIHNPRFSSARKWSSLREMASFYADLISKSGEKSILLGGWSFGGVAAYETALQLQKKGVIVRGIVLIDSPSPINHVPLSETLIKAVVDLDRGKSSDLTQLVKSQFRLNSAILGEYNPFESDGVCPPLVLLRSSEGFRSERLETSKIPTWLADRTSPRQAAAGWEKISGSSVKIMDIRGNHFEPFKPFNIEHTGHTLAEACNYLECL